MKIDRGRRVSTHAASFGWPGQPEMRTTTFPDGAGTRAWLTQRA
jgi:hypothetical protein